MLAVLLLGLLPPAMAQFPVECNDACAPTNTFYSSCGALPYEEGMACLGTLCVSPNLESLAECINCSSPLAGMPPDAYYKLFGCTPPEVNPSPTPSTSATTPDPTCRPPKSNGNGNGHGWGKGGRPDKGGNGNGHGHDSDSD